jgi:hypothetical protein
MKLNDANPTQHLAIVILAGVFIFLNVVEGWKASSKKAAKEAGQEQIVTTMVDSATGAQITRPTRFHNPQLSWYETIFCKGLQRSSNCSFRLLHPFAVESEELGLDVPDGEPKQDHVVYYRGSINKNMALSDSIESPEAVPPPIKIAR